MRFPTSSVLVVRFTQFDSTRVYVFVVSGGQQLHKAIIIIIISRGMRVYALEPSPRIVYE